METLEQILTIITPVLITLAGWIAVRVEMRVKRMKHVELESYHREALHLALETGVKLAISKVLRDGQAVDAHVADIKSQGVAWARRSVPDAIAYLGAQFDQLLDLAESKIGDVQPLVFEKAQDIDWGQGELAL